MSVKVFADTKIYIACPANSVTGGPELLHQLAYHLRNDLQIHAFMYYYDFRPGKFESPVHSEYRVYELPYVLEIPKNDDNSKNILIVPEIHKALKLLLNFINIRKGIWFLSVDNYYISKLTKRNYFIQRAINKISERIFKKRLLDFDITSQEVLSKLIQKYDYRTDPLLKLANFYMTNTYRGLRWFSELKPLYYLSEYLNKSFLEAQTDISKKEDIVVYNPKKGFSFTKKIISSAKDIKFIPLINMTRDEVIKTLQRAKVYIDFGNHPGKDRIPREAAILGCCVITGKRGSAAFFEDVPIPDEYKFEDKEESIPKIIEKIKDCFRNFEERYKDFEYYRKVIRNEPQKFIEDLKRIFIKAE
ncbi:MAG: hypothetical protein ACO2PO_23115 [Candidatus Calescibacterium sp.]